MKSVLALGLAIMVLHAVWTFDRAIVLCAFRVMVDSKRFEIVRRGHEYQMRLTSTGE